MPAGRPTKLTPALLAKARTYLDECVDEIHTTDKGSIAYVDVKLPSIVGMALFLDVNKDTIVEWSKVPGEFSVIMKKIMSEQERRLIDRGLGGIYSAKPLGAMLSKHGYREGTDVTSNGNTITGAALLNSIADGTEAGDNTEV